MISTLLLHVSHSPTPCNASCLCVPGRRGLQWVVCGALLVAALPRSLNHRWLAWVLLSPRVEPTVVPSPADRVEPLSIASSPNVILGERTEPLGRASPRRSRRALAHRFELLGIASSPQTHRASADRVEPLRIASGPQGSRQALRDRGELLGIASIPCGSHRAHGGLH